MHQLEIDEISAWLVERGLVGASENELLDGFCERCQRMGLELSRGLAVIDALHPIFEGRGFFWRDDDVEEEAVVEYGPSSVGEMEEKWQRSAFFHLHQTGKREVRRRLGMGEPADFYLLDVMKAEGHTDFVALAHRFGSDGTIGEMDCFYSHWADRPRWARIAAPRSSLRSPWRSRCWISRPAWRARSRAWSRPSGRAPVRQSRPDPSRGGSDDEAGQSWRREAPIDKPAGDAPTVGAAEKAREGFAGAIPQLGLKFPGGVELCPHAPTRPQLWLPATPG